MTDQERAACLQGAVDALNRVLDRQEADLEGVRQRNDSIDAKVEALTPKVDELTHKVSQTRSWLIAAVVLLALLIALDALIHLLPPGLP